MVYDTSQYFIDDDSNVINAKLRFPRYFQSVDLSPNGVEKSLILPSNIVSTIGVPPGNNKILYIYMF